MTTNLIESLATAILLIVLVLFAAHLLSGTAKEWLSSKFKAAPAATQ